MSLSGANQGREAAAENARRRLATSRAEVAAAATNAGIGASCVDSSTRMPATSSGACRAMKQVPVGIERPDIDAPLAHAIENVARGDEIAAHLGIKARTLGRAVRQQMMAECIESRMRMLNCPPRAPAKGVVEAAERRILADDEIGTVDRVGPPPRRHAGWAPRAA